MVVEEVWEEEKVLSDIASEGPDCRARPKVILQLLGDDFFVDVEVWDPVFVHIGRGRHG